METESIPITILFVGKIKKYLTGLRVNHIPLHRRTILVKLGKFQVIESQLNNENW